MFWTLWTPCPVLLKFLLTSVWFLPRFPVPQSIGRSPASRVEFRHSSAVVGFLVGFVILHWSVFCWPSSVGASWVVFFRFVNKSTDFFQPSCVSCIRVLLSRSITQMMICCCLQLCPYSLRKLQVTFGCLCLRWSFCLRLVELLELTGSLGVSQSSLGSFTPFSRPLSLLGHRVSVWGKTASFFYYKYFCLVAMLKMSCLRCCVNNILTMKSLISFHRETFHTRSEEKKLVTL